MQENNKTLVQKMADAITNHRWVFFSLLIALFLLSVSTISWQIIDSSLNKKSQLAAEKVQKAYSKYLTAKDSKKDKPNSFQNRKYELKQEIELVDGKYRKRYCGFLVALIKAQWAKDEKNFDNAAEIMENCASKSNYPLAVSMLMEAAVYQENSGNIEKAFDLYKLAKKRFPKSFVNDRIIYNLGRLALALDDEDLARSYFNMIAEEAFDSESSDFAKIAKSQLIKLDAEFINENINNEETTE